MAEYIEREKILDAISEQRRFYLHERDGETDMEKLYLLWGSDNALTTMEDIMSDIPTADVAPVVHGRWIYDRNATDWGIGGYICSECKTRNNNLPCNRIKTVSLCSGAKFCPNCGAKMDLMEG